MGAQINRNSLLNGASNNALGTTKNSFKDQPEASLRNHISISQTNVLMNPQNNLAGLIP